MGLHTSLSHCRCRAFDKSRQLVIARRYKACIVNIDITGIHHFLYLSWLTTPPSNRHISFIQRDAFELLTDLLMSLFSFFFSWCLHITERKKGYLHPSISGHTNTNIQICTKHAWSSLSFSQIPQATRTNLLLSKAKEK